MKVRSTVSAVLAVMLLGSIVIAHGGAFGPTKVPIERILPQIEARLAKNPEDAHSEYLLGRVHNGAFARSSASINSPTVVFFPVATLYAFP